MSMPDNIIVATVSSTMPTRTVTLATGLLTAGAFDESAFEMEAFADSRSDTVTRTLEFAG